MEKEPVSGNGRAGVTDMQNMSAVIGKQCRYTDISIFPEDDEPENDEMANALCLMNLMINKNRLRKDVIDP